MGSTVSSKLTPPEIPVVPLLRSGGRVRSMMIVDILSEDLIIPNLRGRTRDEALSELVERISKLHEDVDEKLALNLLIDRERIGSTGIGNGIAIPHAKLPKIQRAIACFARSLEGVEFGSHDG